MPLNRGAYMTSERSEGTRTHRGARDDSATRADGSLPEAEGSSSSAAPLLDYATVSRYWSKARPSIMGPYMMDGFGFPASAGSYRFDAECEIVERLVRSAGIDSRWMPCWIWAAVSATGRSISRGVSEKSYRHRSECAPVRGDGGALFPICERHPSE